MELLQIMSYEAWLTMGVILACLVVLSTTAIAPDAVLFFGVFTLMFTGVLPVESALSGFSHPGMITVGVLYVVASALLRTGVVAWISDQLLGKPKGIGIAQLRLMLPVAAMSAFLNNTPVVAMLVPAVSNWAKRFNLSASQLMMPLSYAAISGGVCSLIGTSTNLVVNGLLLKQNPEAGLGLFEIALVGLPCVFVTVIFILVFSRFLLPNKQGAMTRFEDARRYIIEFRVEPNSTIIGKTIEQAGLRNLPGVFLMEIERSGVLLPAVSPMEVLHGNDRLVFAGNVDSVVDLQKMNGLVPAENQIYKLEAARVERCLVEAVISPQFPGLGRTVKEFRFRERYDAVIIAVSRAGENIRGRIGEIELRPGDVLLVEAPSEFPRRMQYSRDFLLVSEIEDSRVPHYEKAATSAGIMAIMVAVVSFGLLSMFQGALLAAGAMILTRCISVHNARQSIDWQVLLVIAASIALGSAVESTGAASATAKLLMGLFHSSPQAVLAGIFILTVIFTAIISNVAAAVLMYPIASASAASLGVDVTPFAIALMIAASSSFATPIGYQTNLMVMGPGDYKFSDFLKMGIPLTVLITLTAVYLIPLFWPF